MTTTTTDTNHTVLSRHNTSDGVVTWFRCDHCGALLMRLSPADNEVPLAAGKHKDGCPTCGELASRRARKAS